MWYTHLPLIGQSFRGSRLFDLMFGVKEHWEERLGSCQYMCSHQAWVYMTKCKLALSLTVCKYVSAEGKQSSLVVVRILKKTAGAGRYNLHSNDLGLTLWHMQGKYEHNVSVTQ